MSKSKITSNEKKGFKIKLLEFKKKGLMQYAKYLNDQLKASAGKKIKVHYTKYIEDQIVNNNKKIEKINSKMAA